MNEKKLYAERVKVPIYDIPFFGKTDSLRKMAFQGLGLRAITFKPISMFTPYTLKSMSLELAFMVKKDNVL